MPTIRKPPAKAACLTCREAKVRCNGKQPCSKCSVNNLTCSYRPSQRGGIRRRPRHGSQSFATPLSSFQTEPLSRPVDHTLQQGSSPAERSSVIYNSGNVINLLAPFRGIQNLNMTSNTAGADDLPLDSGNGKQSNTDESAVRMYASNDDILNAYYIYIHPFLPILPPPVSIQPHDMPMPMPMPIDLHCSTNGSPNLDSLPYRPTSSLTLAISAILALIPLPKNPCSVSYQNLLLRRSRADLFAKAAHAEVDNELERITRTASQPINASGEQMSLHGISRSYPVLALSMLSVYEYCQRGSISRMRSRANQAVATAMDLSLHSLGITSTEADRRAWWNAILVLYLSSIDLQTPPIISFTDPRITTPFPSFQGTSQLWSLLLEAEQSLISAIHIFDHEPAGHHINVSSPDTQDKFLQMDSHLLALIRKLGYLPQPTYKAGSDVHASHNIQLISSLFIHCARIRLHQARAFKEIPIFMEKYCGLSSIDEEGGINWPISSIRSQDIDSVFPFTEKDSSIICLKSALAISRGFELLPLTNSYLEAYRNIGIGETSSENGSNSFLLPFFVCSAVQSSYVLLMCYYRLRAALVAGNIAPCHYLLNNPEADSEVQEVERLMREIRQGLESIIGALNGARMFEGVGGMSKEIHIAYQSAVLGS